MNNHYKIKILILIYINLSALEYISHRWIMHYNKDKSNSILWKIIKKDVKAHEIHHTSVQPDMTLDVSSLENKYSGLFFYYKGTLGYSIILYIFFTFQFKLFKINMENKNKIILILFIVFFYSLLSNSLHLEMHDEKDIILPSTKGVSNRHQNIVANFIPTFWLNYIVLNHHNHHRYKSTSNFNFILPLFDHLIGTYKS